MSAKNIWASGILGAGLVSILGITTIAPRMQNDLSNEVHKALAEAGILEDIDVYVDGQDIRLKIKPNVSDAEAVKNTAHTVLNKIGIPNRVNLPSGDWISGPIAAVKITLDSHQPTKGDTANFVSQSASSSFDEQSSNLSSTFSEPQKSTDLAIDSKAIAKARSCEQRLSKALSHRNIGFKFSTYKLDKRGRMQIALVYKAMATCPRSVKFVVQGHTDAVGDDRTNQLISLARAESVANALIDFGLSEDRISYEGVGANEPVSDNVTFKGRAKNRRVVFKVLAQ